MNTQLIRLEACRTPLATSLLALLLAAAPLRATDHSGNVGTETWALAGSPHYLTGNVTVLAGER